MTVVWDNIPTTVTVTGQTGTVTYNQGTVSITTGTIGTPTGAAGGDLTGTYPDPTVHRIHGHNMQSGQPSDGEIWYYHNAGSEWQHRSIAAAGIAAASHTHTASQVSAAGSSGQVMFNSGGAFAGDAGLTYDATTDTLTVGTAGSGAIVMGNGEFLSNSTNGTVRIGTNGTASTDFAMTVDGTSWGFGVTLGTRRNSDGSTTAGGFLCNTAWRMGNGVEFAMGGANWYTLSYQESTRGVLAVGLLVGSSGSSGSMVLCQNNQKGTANRVPSIAHDDPTLYVYGRGSTNAADYVRINHNTTDGFVESGRGQLRLTAPSSSGGGVRIDSSWYGINLAPTAVQTGYTAFTNPATTRTCNTATVTLQQLAQIVGTLVEDLKTKGVISA